MIKYSIKIFFWIFTGWIVGFFTGKGFSYESSGETPVSSTQKYDATETTMHHLLDSYSWEFYKKSNGHYAAIHLPRIFWNPVEKNLKFFLNTESAINAGYFDRHHFDHEARHGQLLVPQFKELADNLNLNGSEDQKKFMETISKYVPVDFSISKNVLYLIFACLLLLFVFFKVAEGYKINYRKAPAGVQSFFEPIIVFIRDDVAKPNISHNYDKYMPFLLTMFFYIWFLNLLGLTPFSANVTGNISVTCSLALITFTISSVKGTAHYWQHIIWMKDAPIILRPLMAVVEIISMFAKPFALTIRLFANITAGHVIILSFIGLIFVIGEMGQNPVAGWGTSVFSTVFILFIYALELFVAILQAYIFTILSAMYIGSALEKGH